MQNISSTMRDDAAVSILSNEHYKRLTSLETEILFPASTVGFPEHDET